MRDVKRATTTGPGYGAGLGLRRDEPALEAAPPAPEPRLTGLDALRGAAMILVVVAHAAYGYVRHPVPHLVWAVQDRSAALFFDVLVWGSISVAMPAFFTLGGFFAARIYDSRGLRGFIKDRVRRILGPFLDGGAAVLPLSLAAWGAGWLESGRCTWRELLWLDFHDVELRDNHWGPAHLWFLEYLVLMLAAFAGVRAIRHRLRPHSPGSPVAPSRPVGQLLFSPLAPVLLAFPTAWILFEGHRQSGLDAVMSLRNTFVPDTFRWSHHAWFFVVGAWLSGQRRDLGLLAAHGTWWLGFSLPVFAVRARLLAQDLVVPLDGLEAVALAASGALFAWLALFGLVGLCQRWFRHPSPAVRYLADGSYWIYLVHFPVVGMMQVALLRVPCAAGWKFAIVLAVTMATCLLSYQRLVRHTQLGLWLHGPRHLPKEDRRRYGDLYDSERRYAKKSHSS
jgi:peptidoglycan/LPS O-acetylase OafA/YrhL